MTVAGSSGTPTEEESGPTTEPQEPRWVLVEVADVSMDLPSAYPEVVLRESDVPHRELRIPMGLAEGTAIAYAFRHLDTPRPLTHELFSVMLLTHQVSVEAVRITARHGQVLHSEIETMGPRGRQLLECRPSDGIALALRNPTPVPIVVADDVLEAPGSAGA